MSVKAGGGGLRALTDIFYFPKGNVKNYDLLFAIRPLPPPPLPVFREPHFLNNQLSGNQGLADMSLRKTFFFVLPIA